MMILIFFTTGVARSQVTPSDNKRITNLDKTVETSAAAFFKNGKRVGLSIGIYSEGRELYYNYGTTTIGKQVLPTSGSVYEIGSISKTFTGTLLAATVAAGKAKMEDDVRKYISKKYGAYPNLEYNCSPIKLSHLVSHISGLPLFLPDKPELFTKPNFETLPLQITSIQIAYSRYQFFEDLHKVKLDTIPGYKFNYSNASAQLLQYLLEEIHQKTYEELLKDYITNPLGMNSTTSVLPKDNLQAFVKGYNENGKLMPYNPTSLASAGGILSSASDMLKYLQFHLDEKNNVVALSHKVVSGDPKGYAVGLNWQQLADKNNMKKLWQSGGTFGFGSYSVLYPGTKMAIVLLSNESDPGTQAELEKIANAIYASLTK